MARRARAPKPSIDFAALEEDARRRAELGVMRTQGAEALRAKLQRICDNALNDTSSDGQNTPASVASGEYQHLSRTSPAVRDALIREVLP